MDTKASIEDRKSDIKVRGDTAFNVAGNLLGKRVGATHDGVCI
jgi:hypothetical protein